MDVTTAIQDELRKAPTVEPHWLTIGDAITYTGLSRSKLYELIAGKVRSVCLRDQDKTRGTRLVSRASLESYFSKFEGKKSEPVPGPKGRKRK